jgi:DNA-binding NtrC family response regulator
MNVLIVEDNAEKSELLETILRSEFKGQIDFAQTISGAYSQLEHHKWDLVILDMTFQISQGLGQAVRKEALAGLEILQFMSSKNLTYPVIVATQHSVFSGVINLASVEELHALLSETFPEIYRETIRVDLTTTDWHATLLNAAKRVV